MSRTSLLEGEYISRAPLKKSAERVRKAGRGGDTVLVHINPKERAHLERQFGKPGVNTHTGLPEWGLFSKLKKAVKFENFGVKRLIKGIKKNPTVLLTGASQTPLSTKLHNTIFGTKLKPLTNQLGGHSASAYEEYGRDPGLAPTLNKVAGTIAGFYAGGAVGDLAGGAAGSMGAGAGASSAIGSVAGNAAVTAANKSNEAGAEGMDTSVMKTNKKKATSLLLGRASELADRPYTEYEGERVAGMSDNERQASMLARTPDPRINENLDNATNAIKNSTKEFNSSNLEQYLSPYRDSGIAKENEEFDRQRSSLLNSKAGAFGGDRAAFQESELNRQHLGSLSDINATAYRDATNAFFADSDRQARAAEAYRGVAGDVSQLNRQQIQDLMATGGIERVLNQANLDFDYQQFTEARDWDVTNLEPLLRALGTTGQPGANPKGDNTAAALGAAATIAGAYFSGGGGGGGSAGGSVGGSYASQATAAGVS